MDKQRLNRLAEEAINQSWGTGTPEGHYPNTLLFNYCYIAHPEIIAEYEKWFDSDIRGKKGARNA